ncbi:MULTISPECIES: hypothetical protein [unclassified Coleofasciculus]|uniref:hypothetical protein n=1 Tax=unclassified Coleofasciculus TaxID=2692782 RepID=UPI001880D0E6|nr:MULTISPECIES: hypothetical protein [unclassified Coleofasciculus]MBE9127405.1 hypothetical protein [Coleofasciculus sp. LEGE 07081]MBE9147169.1 hypothetical protein [Coleofasciculus sp. LEGE 07092]
MSERQQQTIGKTNTIPLVDLVIVMDTSGSMKDEAQALSDAAEAAIEAAKSSCPSDLRVVWVGIEGTWKGTHFNRTIRDYLTQECHVIESALRGRKRGEVPQGGAQEDGARAIEDISEHFDWRAGAAKAMFYLGDEAIEGGGKKTEQEDIEAANLAIQKAKQFNVTVHTYLGTLKSKHREGIQAEYARIAQETGGQAFTDRDAIGGFTEVLEMAICSSCPAAAQTPKFVLHPGMAYVQDCVSDALSHLYRLDLKTGKAILVGAIATEVSDITFVGSELYGLDQKDGTQTMQLVKIDPVTGKAAVIGDVGFYAVGLAYDRSRNTLYATTAKQLLTIDIKTGKGTPAVTVADEDYNCSEVAFDRHGTAYITLIGYEKKKLLATCNLNTGAVTPIGDTGFPNLSSLEFFDDVLYGVTGNFFGLGNDGELLQIDTTTGAGTFVTLTEPLGRWAGIGIYEAITEEKKETPKKTEPESKVKEKDNSLSGQTKPESKIKHKEKLPKHPRIPVNLEQLSFDSFGRDSQRDIVCVTPIRTVVRREEEIIIIRKVRKVEEIDVSPACPINTLQVSPDQ